MKKERKDIVNQSIKKTRERVTITIKKEEGQIIKEKIKKSGQSMNEFIIEAIRNEIKNRKL